MLRFLILIFSLLPGLALAQANIFEPVAGDKSMMVLGSLFGGLGTFGSSGVDPFLAGINAFNSAVLTIGGVLVSYTILIGTIGTAHDGEMLGKKFSSAWVPIRTAAGTALVLPVIGGGYCIMQALVGWLVVQGIGLADLIWAKYTESESLKMIASAGLPNINAKDFGYKTFQTVACYEGMKAVIEKNKDNLSFPPLNPTITKSTVGNSIIGTSEKLEFGVSPAAGGFDVSSCGSIEIPKTYGMGSGVGESSTFMSNFNWNDATRAKQRAEAITQAQYTASNQLIERMSVIARNMISTMSVGNATQIDAVIADYEGSVRKASADQIKSLKEFEKLGQEASADGWFLAGAFYTKISYMTDLVQRSMTKVGTASGPLGANNNLTNDEMGKYEALVGTTLKGVTSSPTAMGFGISSANGREESLMDNFSIDKLMKRVFYAESFVMNDGEHPLMAMKRMGNWLTSVGAGALIVAFGLTVGKASIVGSVVGLVTGGVSTAAAGFITTIVLIAVIPMLMTGLTLSYILPMMPFFIWFGAVVGWIVLVVEAILAAPMWAVMHLSPHGDDLVGTGSQGYKLVLSLMLRPVLMVFGLITSFVMLSVLGQVLNTVFFGVFALSQQDSSFVTLLGGYLVAPILYSVALYVLLKKLFSMIYVIPDELLKWFGGGGPQLGSYAETIGGERSASNQAFGAIINTGANALRDGSTTLAKGKAEQSLKLSEANKQAQQDKANMLKTGALAEKEQDKQYGAGAGEFISSVSGGDEFTSAQTEKDLANTIAPFAEGSEDRMRFMSKLSKLTKDNSSLPPGEQLTAKQMLSSAAEQTLDHSYGSGAGKLAMSIGGEVGSADYNRAVNAFQTKASNLMSGGASADQAKDMISGMVSTVNSRFESEGGNIKNILKEESGKLTAGFVGSNNSTQQETGGLG